MFGWFIAAQVKPDDPDLTNGKDDTGDRVQPNLITCLYNASHHAFLGVYLVLGFPACGFCTVPQCHAWHAGGGGSCLVGWRGIALWVSGAFRFSLRLAKFGNRACVFDSEGWMSCV